METRHVIVLRCEDVPLRGLLADNVYQDLVGITNPEHVVIDEKPSCALLNKTSAQQPCPRFDGAPTHPRVELAVLAVQYGMEAESLAARAQVPHRRCSRAGLTHQTDVAVSQSVKVIVANPAMIYGRVLRYAR